MPLPPPVTTAVLPPNSVMCTSLAFRGRSRYGPSPTSSPVGKRSVRAMSSRQAPPDLVRELLEEIDSPCLGSACFPSTTRPVQEKPIAIPIDLKPRQRGSDTAHIRRTHWAHTRGSRI